MKKILMLTSAVLVLASYSANAQVSVTFGEPAPVYAPGYVAAPDWPSEHYDIHRHRHNDYWAGHDHHEAPHDDHHR